MPAPKRNKYAARPGVSKKHRIRIDSGDPEADHAVISGLGSYQRGLAMIGYLMWLESPESDESSFIDWMKEQADYGQYD